MTAVDPSQPWPHPLRVWWVPQIPGTAFRTTVDTPKEAKLLMVTLGKYDLFQFEQRVKPDYSNAGGVEEFLDGEWLDVDEYEEVWEGIGEW